ncbi:nucleotide sugar dehydrogenase [Clostridiaceae bacterium M8S5]|nr:nucleotide sugar dehydrogenase [Clostridiaceae bacterium M8S5]
MLNEICVVGLGYIGLPTLITLALNGFKVFGVDKNKKVVKMLDQGLIHIKEPNLEKHFGDLIYKNKISIRNNLSTADVFMICVPTPIDNDGKCDLSHVIKSVKEVCQYLKKGDLIIVESTVPPTTTENIIKPIIEEKGFKVGKDVFLSHCPERVLPGNIMHEIIFNSRIIGGCTDNCNRKTASIYNKFVKGEIILTDSKTAEMAKLYENTFRDINIAIANELIKICNKLGIDGLKVIEYANKHPRVDILKPGPGVGGHCLAVDPYFIIEKCKSESKLIATARKINNSMPYFIVDKVKKLLSQIKKPKISVFGLTYKENIDDIRESPALKIVKILEKIGYQVQVYDPLIRYYEDSVIDSIVEDSDLILILTAHNQFREIDYKRLASKMRTPMILDTRNALNIEDEDIKYYNLGNIN